MTTPKGTVRISHDLAAASERIDRVCKNLYDAQLRTDPVHWIEIPGDFSTILLRPLRQWYRDGVRARTALKALDEMAECRPSMTAIPAKAWILTLILFDRLAEQKRGTVVQKSLEHARQHGIEWTVEVVAHWLDRPFADRHHHQLLRKESLPLLITAWHANGSRKHIAPAIGALTRRGPLDTSSLAGTNQDWHTALQLLPRIPADRSHLREEELMLAGGVLDGAQALDRNGQCGRDHERDLRDRLGPEFPKAMVGLRSLLHWENRMEAEMQATAEYRDYESCVGRNHYQIRAIIESQPVYSMTILSD